MECTSRLRKIENEILLYDSNYKRQKIIVSSANADVETSKLAFDAGVDGFLEKPLKLQNIYNVYAALLKKEGILISHDKTCL